MFYTKEINYTDLKKEYWDKAKRIERKVIAKKLVTAINVNKKKSLNYK